jgi:hypothetical protein
MRSTTRPILPRCRDSWGMPISERRESTIIVGRGQRTARRSRWSIDGGQPRNAASLSTY